jgi:hypothetical protein
VIGLITAALTFFAGLGTLILKLIFRRPSPIKQAVKTQQDIAQTAATGETSDQAAKDLGRGTF